MKVAVASVAMRYDTLYVTSVTNPTAASGGLAAYVNYGCLLFRVCWLGPE